MALHGGDVELARQASSLPLLAYQEGEEYINSSPEQEIDGHIKEVSWTPSYNVAILASLPEVSTVPLCFLIGRLY